MDLVRILPLAGPSPSLRHARGPAGTVVRLRPCGCRRRGFTSSMPLTISTVSSGRTRFQESVPLVLPY
eukprot:scaffold2691_cov417-Prasinococcus_capsulatus_cf.AAC.23